MGKKNNSINISIETKMTMFLFSWYV